MVKEKSNIQMEIYMKVNFLNDEKNGQGKIYFSNENIYEGKWLNSKKNG